MDVDQADQTVAGPGATPASLVVPGLIFAAVAVLGAVADLWTKHVMFSWPALERSEVYWLLPEVAGFQRSLNEGALFGLGQGSQHWFALVSVVAAIAIPVWLFAYGAARDPWMLFALGGVMGGVIGNLYDRLGMPGLVWGVDWPAPVERHHETIYAVRDWILLQASDAWRWPNFNIADSLLVVGAAVLFLRAWRAPESPPSRLETEQKDA